MSMQQSLKLVAVFGVCAGVAVSSGCASKGFVRQEVKTLESSMDSKMQPTNEQAHSAYTLAQDVDGRTRQLQLETQMARDLALGNVKREEVRRVTVNFAFDSAKIPAEAQPALDAVARDLQNNLNYMGLVSGYTDATGDEQYNISLAQRRAGAVQLYLAQQLGTEFVRLATIGFGAVQPVADNDTSEGRAANRRTEIILVRPLPATAGEVPTASR